MINPLFSISLLFTVFSSNFTIAQDSVKPDNDYIYSNNSFAISLGNGFNQTQFTSVNGTVTPRPGLGLIPRFNMDYRFSLGNHFGVSVGTGFGFFPFRFKVDANEEFPGTSAWRYWQIIDYEVFSNFRTAVDYNVWLKKRLGLKTSLGGGVIGTTDLHATTSSTSPQGTQYLFAYQFESGFKPYFYLSTQADRVLKNDDVLGLSLSYEYFLNPIYTGAFSLYNNQSNGTLVNNGNNINLALTYTFTRARKLKRAEEMFLEDENVTFRDAKRELKKVRRYIDPKSMFFGLNSGLFIARNQVGLGDHLLVSGGAPSWVISGNVEKGIKNNHFWQAGLSISETWSYVKLNRPSVFWASGGNEFVSVQASFGLGTRLISQKSNINYLNVSAGLGIGVHTNRKGLSGHTGGSGGSQSQTTYEYLVTFTTKRNMYPTLYLNLSRDFQMTKSLYLSVDYRFNWGMLNVVEGAVEYRELPDFNQVFLDQINIKGTSNAFQLGVKYKLVPRKK